MLRRFEAYSIREGAPAAVVQSLRVALRDCARFIPEVLDSAVGTNRSREPLHLVWEHAYASPEAYRRYMAHPFHAAVLDRYLLADSPERIVSDNGLGAGLFGYACDGPAFRGAVGVRRVVLLEVASSADREAVAALAAAARHAPGDVPGLVVSVLAANSLASRWFDGAREVSPPPRWTHVWEQGFRSLADLAGYRAGGSPLARAERDGWSGWAGGVVRGALQLEYEIERGETASPFFPEKG